jgi:hypothetical protein
MGLEGSTGMSKLHPHFRILRNKRAKFELDEFLSRPLLAHLSTTSEQGARNSVFWFIWEDDALWMILEEGFNNVQGRVRKDSRVAVGVVDFDSRSGFFQHVSIRGRASLEPWADDRAGRVLRRYYRHLDGYVASPRRPGERTTGRFPMTFLRVVPESVMLREMEYRTSVLGKSARPGTGCRKTGPLKRSGVVRPSRR